MEVKLKKLINSKYVLLELGNTKGLSGIVSYSILKNIKNINRELDVYDKARIKICEENANKDDKGNPIIKNNSYDMDEKSLAFVNSEIEKLKEEIIDIDIKKINITDIDKAGLSAFEIESIDYMLNDN